MLLQDEAPFQFKDNDAFSTSFWFKNEPGGFYTQYEVFIGRFTDKGNWYVAWNPDSMKIQLKIQDTGT